MYNAKYYQSKDKRPAAKKNGSAGWGKGHWRTLSRAYQRVKEIQTKYYSCLPDSTTDIQKQKEGGAKSSWYAGCVSQVPIFQSGRISKYMYIKINAIWRTRSQSKNSACAT